MVPVNLLELRSMDCKAHTLHVAALLAAVPQDRNQCTGKCHFDCGAMSRSAITSPTQYTQTVVCGHNAIVSPLCDPQQARLEEVQKGCC